MPHAEQNSSTLPWLVSNILTFGDFSRIREGSPDASEEILKTNEVGFYLSSNKNNMERWVYLIVPQYCIERI